MGSEKDGGVDWSGGRAGESGGSAGGAVGGAAGGRRVVGGRAPAPPRRCRRPKGACTRHTQARRQRGGGRCDGGGRRPRGPGKRGGGGGGVRGDARASGGRAAVGLWAHLVRPSKSVGSDEKNPAHERAGGGGGGGKAWEAHGSAGGVRGLLCGAMRRAHGAGRGACAPGTPPRPGAAWRRREPSEEVITPPHRLAQSPLDPRRLLRRQGVGSGSNHARTVAQTTCRDTLQKG